jgi:hypothetical protein
MRTTFHLLLATSCFLLLVSCAQSPTDPSGIGTVDQFVNSLLARDFTVSLNGEMNNNGYFTVSSHEILVNAARVKAFEYPTAARADQDAALISPDGQPNPRAAISWISTPHFYKQGRLIVLYVGCTATITRALEECLGPAIAAGPGCD